MTKDEEEEEEDEKNAIRFTSNNFDYAKYDIFQQTKKEKDK